MHVEAYEWITRSVAKAQPPTPDIPLAVLDIGGRDINGTCRPLFPDCDYTSLDIRPGKGVDVVADVTTWIPPRWYDIVIVAEVLEHAENWRDIVRSAVQAAAPGGQVVVTCAGPAREPHSAIDGGPLRPSEWYSNLAAGQVRQALVDAGCVRVTARLGREGQDVYAAARAATADERDCGDDDQPGESGDPDPARDDLGAKRV